MIYNVNRYTYFSPKKTQHIIGLGVQDIFGLSMVTDTHGCHLCEAWTSCKINNKVSFSNALS